MSEICDKKRGSLACEECDNWIIVKVVKSQEYPMGVALEECKLGRKEMEEMNKEERDKKIVNELKEMSLRHTKERMIDSMKKEMKTPIFGYEYVDNNGKICHKRVIVGYEEDNQHNPL